MFLIAKSISESSLYSPICNVTNISHTVDLTENQLDLRLFPVFKKSYTHPFLPLTSVLGCQDVLIVSFLEVPMFTSDVQLESMFSQAT